MGSEQYTDPRRVANVLLAAAMRSGAEAVFLEPSADGYAVTLERGANVFAEVPLDAQLGAAVIARLAFVARLDLATTSATSAVVPVRVGDRAADIVVTLRPGIELRAELVVVSRPPAVTAYRGPLAGELIGQYRVIEQLGQGGMGTVYRVEHAALGRHSALKVLRKKVIARDPSAAEKFLREARTAARIRHTNIVDVLDFGHLPDGRPYFIMELLDGESLGARVARGPLPPLEVISIARQLANALAAAHDRGVIHADVTPANAFVLHDSLHVKLLDFGLAQLAGESAADNPDFVVGTPSYISPEQLRGHGATERSDQYGLGAVLFELLAGTPPYVDIDVHAICMKHLTAPIPEITSPHGPVPTKLANLIVTCLQKAPQARFANMRALIAVLDDLERVVERSGWRRWLGA